MPKLGDLHAMSAFGVQRWLFYAKGYMGLCGVHRGSRRRIWMCYMVSEVSCT